MRILGIDYGDKNIGIAISDPFGWTAQGLEIIRRENESEYKKTVRRIAEIIADYEVESIVLGYPKNMNNTEGVRCEKTKAFKERLEKRFPGMEVILWDERLSTMGAERFLTEGGITKERKKAVIDKMAAVHILQGYLDSIGH